MLTPGGGGQRADERERPIRAGEGVRKKYATHLAEVALHVLPEEEGAGGRGGPDDMVQRVFISSVSPGIKFKRLGLLDWGVMIHIR